MPHKIVAWPTLKRLPLVNPLQEDAFVIMPHRQNTTMKRSRYTLILALAAIVLSECNAQLVEPCPSNGALSGYTSISAMNSDMATELQRISGGGTPEDEYIYTLCPRLVFDATIEPLRPVLSGIVFQCGVLGSSTDSCTIDGGSEQIRVEDSGVASYQIEDISFKGLTFQSFTNSANRTGASVNVLASDTTSINFTDVVWTVSKS